MEDIAQQILDELKSINKKLDALSPSLEIDTDKFIELIQHHQKVNHDTVSTIQ